MDRLVDHIDTAEVEAGVVAQGFVVIAGDIDDGGAFARLAQQFLHHRIVGGGPVPRAFQPPTVDDVADEIDGFSIIVAQEVEQQFGFAARCAEMDVGEEKRAVLCAVFRARAGEALVEVRAAGEKPSLVALAGHACILRHQRGQVVVC